MGEYVGIRIGLHEFLSYKNTFGDLLTIFCPENQCVKECIDDNGESYLDYSYITTAERAKRCLDCLGYTIYAAKSSFEKSKHEEIRFRDEYYDEYNKNYDLLDSQTIEKEFTFDKWTKVVKHYSLLLSRPHSTKNLEKQRKRKQLSLSEKMVLDSLPYNNNERFFGVLFEYASRWAIFRVILDEFEPNTQVVLNYTNLYNGGWCDEVPDDDEFSVSKTIILTEGKYDTEVIQKSMDILYPYMKKYYSLIDFSSLNIQGSANFLTHYVKAFIGAGILNRVIALYDNDSAGLSEIELLKGINLPSNFRVFTLPRIEIGENYPTIGPTKDECVDINGRACSIELFLGGDVLTEKGTLIPIMWKGYIDRIGSYQGEITKKSEIQKRFNKKVEYAKQNGITDLGDWKEIDLLLNVIFQSFVSDERK